jgi:Uma2 family endonuclease
MVAALKIPAVMTVAEFLAWDAPQGTLWQLVDGEPQAMAPASRTHGAIQSELAGLIRNHLVERGSRCSVITTPGIVPRVRADRNFRIPDLAVTCAGYQQEEYALSGAVLVIEILSPSNQAETWTNVWAYTTIPGVQEILVVRSASVGAELLRRGADGSWPEQAVQLTEGLLELDSIGFKTALADLYRTTRLGSPAI